MRHRLWPGEDLRSRFRDPITEGSLVFVACFSANSVAKEKAHQHEELNLAIEQLRMMPSDESRIQHQRSRFAPPSGLTRSHLPPP